MQIKEIKQRIIDRLSDLGVAIHVYHAYSTKSIYIKLDYGALGSIRISDHTGKKKYSYKYNIGTDIEEYVEVLENGKERKYYPCKDIDKLICDILIEHCVKTSILDYEQMKQEKKENRNTDVSFWRNCKEIRG